MSNYEIVRNAVRLGIADFDEKNKADWNQLKIRAVHSKLTSQSLDEEDIKDLMSLISDPRILSAKREIYSEELRKLRLLQENELSKEGIANLTVAELSLLSYELKERTALKQILQSERSQRNLFSNSIVMFGQFWIFSVLLLESISILIRGVHFD